MKKTNDVKRNIITAETVKMIGFWVVYSFSFRRDGKYPSGLNGCSSMSKTKIGDLWYSSIIFPVKEGSVFCIFILSETHPSFLKE